MYPCMNTGSLGDRVEFCFTLLSVDFAVSYSISFTCLIIILSLNSGLPGLVAKLNSWTLFEY